MKSKILLATSVIAIILSMACFGNSVYAKKSPYESGFDHGCSDSHIEDVSDRYINQKEKGPSFHTSAFMNGYYDGFKECGYDNGVLIDNNVNTAIDDSNFDDHSVSQPQQQQAFTNQNAGCPENMVNGDCYIGQSQDVNNEFAQANRNN